MQDPKPEGLVEGPSEESLRGSGTQTTSRIAKKAREDAEAAAALPPKKKTREELDAEARIQAENARLSARMEIAGLLSRRLIFQPMRTRLDRETVRTYAKEIHEAVLSEADSKRHLPVFERAGIKVHVLRWLPKGTCVLMRGPGDVDLVQLES